MLIIRAGIRPHFDCFFRSSLIYVCAVCLDLSPSELVFKILEHLPYDLFSVGVNKKEERALIKEKLTEALLTGQKICIDCSLEDHMSDKVC